MISTGYVLPLSVFLLCVLGDDRESKSYSENSACATLDGTWYNQMGSLMVLNHTKDGELFGEYRTKVERETGSSGYGHSDIVGACPYNKPGSTVAFAVLFKGGTSVTAWTGQCLVCNEDVMLVTSWLLREYVDTCDEKWKSTRIGQDMFIRSVTVLPVDSASHTVSYGPAQGSVGLQRKKKSVFIPCALEGTWYNEMGSEVILHQKSNSHIIGEYRTAVEVSAGSAGSSHSRVYGIANAYSSDTTFAIFVVWRGGASVTGWVGQCHLCGENKSATLEVNWLLRSGIDDCDDNWKATNYGQNSFSRHELAPGPRKHYGIHTPQQDGEDGEGVHEFSMCSASVTIVSTMLFLCTFLLTIL